MGSPMAYSTPAHSLMFNSFVAMSHDTMGHLVSSPSQLQSTTAAKRKNLTANNKNNATKRRRSKPDTMEDVKYNEEEDVVPLTDVTLRKKQREQRRLAAFDTAAVIEVHCLEFMQRAFPPKVVVAEKKKTQSAPTASITACRLQSKVDCIIYVLMHWQVGVKIHQLDPGSERDKLVTFCWQYCNGTKLAENSLSSGFRCLVKILA
jgi:hypothetical protein